MKRQTSLTDFLLSSKPPRTKQRRQTREQRDDDDEQDNDEIKATGSLVIGSEADESDKDKTIIIDQDDDDDDEEEEHPIKEADKEEPLSSINSAETIEIREDDDDNNNNNEKVEEEEKEEKKEEEEKFVKIPSKDVQEILRKYKNDDQPRTVMNLINTIKRINISTKNYWGKAGLEFDGLRLFFRAQPEEANAHFFGVLLDRILDAALRLPEFYATEGPLPIIPAGARGTVKLSQSYAASVVANMFFCAFKRGSATEYLLEPNFQLIYRSTSYAEKLHFFVHYFERVLLQGADDDGDGEGVGEEEGKEKEDEKRDTFIVYERRGEDVAPDWGSSEKPLCAVDFTDEIIEDAGPEFLKADFANRCLGGGVMAHGMVQEEIMFLEAPELLPVRLCFPPLTPKEAAVLMGAERYSAHDGYGYSTTFSGDYGDATEVGDDNVRKSTIVAIDAVHYRSFTAQFAPRMIKRELLKAYA